MPAKIKMIANKKRIMYKAIFKVFSINNRFRLVFQIQWEYNYRGIGLVLP